MISSSPHISPQIQQRGKRERNFSTLGVGGGVSLKEIIKKKKKKRQNKTHISCPASLTSAHSSGNVSSECPGMNQVVLISYLANSFNSLRTPTVPAKRPFCAQIKSGSVGGKKKKKKRRTSSPREPALTGTKRKKEKGKRGGGGIKHKFTYREKCHWWNPRRRRSRASPRRRQCPRRCSRGRLWLLVNFSWD